MFVFEFAVRMRMRVFVLVIAIDSTSVQFKTMENKNMLVSLYLRSVSFYRIETVNDVNPSGNGTRNGFRSLFAYFSFIL